MSKQANPTVIGGFVLGAITLFVMAILVFGSGALFRERVPMVTFFPGSIQGLSVGAQVQFEGVTVGRVTGIELSYSPESGKFSVPVSYELWPDSVRILGTASDDPAEEILRRLVKDSGLHARLESLSFVTGQYIIALQLAPGRPIRLVKDPTDVVEVPSLEATRDRVTEMLENLHIDDLANEVALTLAAIRQLIGSEELPSLIEALKETLAQAQTLITHLDQEVRPLGERLDSTLSDYAALARALQASVVPVAENLDAATTQALELIRRLDDQVVPVSGATVQTLTEVEETMRAVRRLAGDVSVTRSRLDQLLSEATLAARSLRSFADVLDRQPEALLRGKR